MAETTRERLARLAAEEAAEAAPERTWGQTIGDNLIGYDDGVQSFGENLATWLNMGGEAATVGLVGDEAAAAAAYHLVPGGGSYEEELAHYRDNEAQMREDHPIASFAADVGGAVAPGLGWAGAAARGANLFTRTLASGAAGTTGGAVNGFMEGEGDNRAANAVVPAGVGGILGALLPGAGALGGAAYRAFGPGAAAALRGAEQKLGLRGAATELASEAVEQDAPFAGARIAASGPDAVNAQMGPNSTGLLNFVATQPGAAAGVRTRVNDFAEGQRAGFERTLDETMGAPEGVVRRQRDLMQRTERARSEAYAKAYQSPIDYSSDAGRRLEGLLEALPGKAIGIAEELMRTARQSSRQRIARVQDDGEVVWETLPDVRQVDFITRALRDMDEPLSGFGRERRGAYRDLARDIRKTLDEMVPEYAAARQQGGDVIANREAMDFGRTLLDDKVTMDVAEDTIAQMGPAERRFAANSLRDTIKEVMANANAVLSDPVADVGNMLRPLRDITNEAGQRKLRALLGPQADEVIRQSKAAYQALALRSRIAVGSDTQPRQAWQARVDAAVPRGPLEAFQEDGTGAALGTVLSRLGGDPRAARLAQQGELLNNVGRLLMEPMQNPNSPLPLLPQLPGLLSNASQMAGYVAGDARRLGGILGSYATGQASR